MSDKRRFAETLQPDRITPEGGWIGMYLIDDRGCWKVTEDLWTTREGAKFSAIRSGGTAIYTMQVGKMPDLPGPKFDVEMEEIE